MASITYGGNVSAASSSTSSPPSSVRVTGSSTSKRSLRVRNRIRALSSGKVLSRKTVGSLIVTLRSSSSKCEPCYLVAYCPSTQEKVRLPGPVGLHSETQKEEADAVLSNLLLEHSVELEALRLTPKERCLRQRSAALAEESQQKALLMLRQASSLCPSDLDTKLLLARKLFDSAGSQDGGKGRSSTEVESRDEEGGLSSSTINSAKESILVLNEIVFRCRAAQREIRAQEKRVASATEGDVEEQKSDAEARLGFLRQKARGMTGELGTLEAVIAAAYAMLGQIFRVLGRKTQAISSLLLSLKESRREDTTASLRSVLSALGDSGQQQNVQDIEDLLSGHQLLGRDDEFSFSCTQCGECCRKAEVCLRHLFFLTPPPSHIY